MAAQRFGGKLVGVLSRAFPDAMKCDRVVRNHYVLLVNGNGKWVKEKMEEICKEPTPKEPCEPKKRGPNCAPTF